MANAEDIAKLDKKMLDCINDPQLPKIVEDYQKLYGRIPEKNLRKRFTI